MAGFSKLMRRLGYAKLDTYGLVLTAEDRILATRPGVLDDGYGGKIVGWRADDLASAELAAWQPVPVAAAAVPPPAIPVPRLAARVGPPPVPMLPKPAPLPAVATAIATFRAPAEEMSEDDWEWEIAVAKARAAAEEAERAARVIPIAAARKPDAKPAVKPVAVAKPKFVAQDPITEVDRIGEDTRVDVQPAKTVIPVPTLPSFKPVQTQPMAVVAPPRRFPKGTIPVTPPAAEITRTDVVAVAPVAPQPTKLPSLRQRTATRG